jgi:hypothetical protein
MAPVVVAMVATAAMLTAATAMMMIAVHAVMMTVHTDVMMIMAMATVTIAMMIVVPMAMAIVEMMVAMYAAVMTPFGAAAMMATGVMVVNAVRTVHPLHLLMSPVKFVRSMDIPQMSVGGAIKTATRRTPMMKWSARKNLPMPPLMELTRTAIPTPVPRTTSPVS